MWPSAKWAQPADRLSGWSRSSISAKVWLAAGRRVREQREDQLADAAGEPLVSVGAGKLDRGELVVEQFGSLGEDEDERGSGDPQRSVDVGGRAGMLGGGGQVRELGQQPVEVVVGDGVGLGDRPTHHPLLSDIVRSAASSRS